MSNSTATSSHMEDKMFYCISYAIKPDSTNLMQHHVFIFMSSFLEMQWM